jgi:YVTN family beta-propeller protein
MNFRSLKTTLKTTLLMVAGLSFAHSSFAGNKGVAYVSSQNGGVTVIDLETFEPKGSVSIDAKGPRGIGVTGDGKWLVTANKGSNNISLVDTSGTTPARLVTIGSNPEFVRVRGNIAFITYTPDVKSGPPSASDSKKGADEGGEKPSVHIAMVDIKQGKVLLDIVGKPEAEGLEFSKDGKKLFVTNESDNSITVHDTQSGKLLQSIAVGQYGIRPRGIKMSPDGKMLVTTLEFADKLLVLNDKLEVIKEVATANVPVGVSFDRKGARIFVAANRAKVLQVFDAKTFEKIKDIPTGERCWHFSFTPDDQYILLACGKSGEIVVVDAKSLEVTKRISDKETPWGIVTYPKSMGSLDAP